MEPTSHHPNLAVTASQTCCAWSTRCAVAFDRTLSDGDVARRVRDLLRKHDGEDLGDND